MAMIPRALVAALLLSLCLLAGGCGGQGEEEQPVQAGPQEETSAAAQEMADTLDLPYAADDSLHPYTAVSVYNTQAAQLLYDPLVRLNPQYEAELCLAQEISLEGTTCTVTLRPDAVFWDGTPVTGGDVEYSLSLAIQSGYYGAGLSNVAGAQASGENQLVITLDHPDQYFDRSLCFPIIQESTAGEALPQGSGRYRMEGNTLVANERHWEPAGPVRTFRLVQMDGGDALNHALRTGQVDYIFTDLREKWYANFTGSYQLVQLNNLVYLGINEGTIPTNTNSLNQVLYDLIDRQELVTQVYNGSALAASIPLNPVFGPTGEYRPSGTEAGSTPSQRLDSLGYSQRDEEGYRLAADGSRLTIQLLYCSDNEYRSDLAGRLEDQLAEEGIALELVGCDAAAYQQRLEAGEYDLYIGEVKLPYNMDIASLLPGGALCYGQASDGTLLEAFRAFQSGEGSYEAFLRAFLEEPPFIPLMFRRGIVSFSSDFNGNVVATEQDIFYNVLEW